MKHSVCIPSYDQPEVCALHLAGIMRSTVLPDEVIIVNDHGPAYLKDLLLKVERKCPVLYAYINEDIAWNYTGARNLSVWLSRSDCISLEDTDHIPFPNTYEMGIKFLDEHKDIDRVIYHTRYKVYKTDALANPVEKWTIIPPARGTHYDLQMMRREAYIKVKGFDERFAGKYAWACTDWRRRLEINGIKTEKVYANYYVILEAETNSLPRLRSKENYSLAKQGGERFHLQSPKGILNFTYVYEYL